jgi:hypothetical protein
MASCASKKNWAVWTWIIVPSLLVSIAVGGAIWVDYPTPYVYGTPPVILAQASPIKVRPNDPGGVLIPYREIMVLNPRPPEASEPFINLSPVPEMPVQLAR